MVQKHCRYLVLVKESPEIEEESLPFHIRLCLAQPMLKTISVRNLYICDRSSLKAKMNNQTQLGRNAVITFEKTLQDIRKAFILPVNEAG